MLSNASKHHCFMISQSETLEGVLNRKLYDLKKLEFLRILQNFTFRTTQPKFSNE